MYDVIIIGAGPAGLTAAIYCARRALKTLVITKDVGGQANWAKRVENYPGILEAAGYELASGMKKQAEKAGAEFKTDEVKSIKKDGNEFLIKTFGFKEKSKAVIVASGLIPRDLGAPGEEKFRGKGVSYCAVCDGPFYKNKTVAVVGGGNSAADAALYLSKIAKKVYLIHRREGFRAEEARMCEVRKAKNVELVLNSVISEIKGSDILEEAIVKNAKTEEKKSLKLDGVFVEIGYITKTDWLKDFVKLNERNEVITDKECATSEAGVFAAGDITNTPYKQIVISAGEGAKAALSVDAYLNPIGGKNGELKPFDWGVCKK